ncbi:uncharacterized protein C4H3.03c [Waddlia chondrophila 2032/99]|uniref:Glycosyl hydrolase, glycosyl hydrolase family 15 n=2 Tax=Waddlia chondrophila TaxID=71667 RepID=D6YUK4_WADCW|nr:glycoside hydrolase family 15 protein [Waddlia chondrophila]ADI37815.1 glycosyl hydrolase, glycosyl hydrolase family 15 [Waddlia chondrophila WSU 86-1044]CCB91973.1 uncharacterized protein C4H3.03c [Waddlia chondrophila 2032/99]
MVYKRIEDYGIIGDLDTVALVGIDGSIDFMCFPYFDSPSVFASLLDHKKGGRFLIAPQIENVVRKQMYLPGSNILLTRALCSGGISEISDYMVIHEEEYHNTLVRRAKAVRGRVKFRIECSPRFDYARCSHKVRQKGNEVIFIPENEKIDAIRLKSEFPLNVQNGDVVSEFILEEGETATFILELGEDEEITPSTHPSYAVKSFKDTMNYWQRWISRSNYRGRWQEMVNRSALTLKLLTSRKYGSIVASPTFGLPEELGGERNWDYRFTWIRDASFTLYGLMRLGFVEESEAFMKWVWDRCADMNPNSPLQIMYGIDGRKTLTEEPLPHFEGYEGSSPVRIGNGAYDQLQLDIYGELMDSVYLYDKYGKGISFDLWDKLKILIDWVTNNWQRKDEGIWEVRGGQKEFLYSRVMCWVAVDRAMRLAQKRSLAAPMEKWHAVRNQIHEDIIKNFWDHKHQAFVQYKNSQSVDASNLLMPMIRYISPVDPRWLSTLQAMKKNLVEDSLVFRYRTQEGAPDGLQGSEGTFNMCSFWYVECLSRSGDVQQARYLFEKMLSYANHLGLYAEELSVEGRQLGNFPQAFTHLALISAAFELNRSLDNHRILW